MTTLAHPIRFRLSLKPLCVCVCVAVAKCVFVCVSMYLTRGHIKMNLGRIHTNMHTQQQNNVNH